MTNLSSQLNTTNYNFSSFAFGLPKTASLETKIDTSPSFMCYTADAVQAFASQLGATLSVNGAPKIGLPLYFAGRIVHYFENIYCKLQLKHTVELTAVDIRVISQTLAAAALNWGNGLTQSRLQKKMDHINKYDIPDHERQKNQLNQKLSTLSPQKSAGNGENKSKADHAQRTLKIRNELIAEQTKDVHSTLETVQNALEKLRQGVAGLENMQRYVKYGTAMLQAGNVALAMYTSKNDLENTRDENLKKIAQSIEEFCKKHQLYSYQLYSEFHEMLTAMRQDIESAFLIDIADKYLDDDLKIIENSVEFISKVQKMKDERVPQNVLINSSSLWLKVFPKELRVPFLTNLHALKTWFEIKILENSQSPLELKQYIDSLNSINHFIEVTHIAESTMNELQNAMDSGIEEIGVFWDNVELKKFDEILVSFVKCPLGKLQILHNLIVNHRLPVTLDPTKIDSMTSIITKAFGKKG